MNNHLSAFRPCRSCRAAALAAAIVILLGPAWRVNAGGAELLSPRTQPLAVVRVPAPGEVEFILSTAPLSAFNLHEHDFSGRVPGFPARMKSLRGFLSALAERKAGDFWYCMVPAGGWGGMPTGLMGFSLPAADAPVDAVLLDWLRQHAFADGELAVRPLGTGGDTARFAVASDSAAFDELFSRSPGRAKNEAWRISLAGFMEGRSDAAGVWVNATPVLGLAALETGIDFRTMFLRKGLARPESLEARVSRAGPDIGLAFRVGPVLSEPWPEPAAPALRVRDGRNALLRLDIPAPLSLAAWLGLDVSALGLVNLNAELLAPRTVGVTLWRGASGDIRWSAVWLLPDDPEAVRQAERLTAWLAVLDNSATGVSAVRLDGRNGRGLRLVRNGLSLILTVAAFESEGKEHLALLLAEDEADYPDIGRLRVDELEKPVLATWETNLDQPAREALGRAFNQTLAGLGVPVRDFMSTLPGDDSGGVGFEKQMLVAESRKGASFFVLPAVAARLAARWKDAKADAAGLAAARLRHILAIVHQSRFRHAVSGRQSTPPLPKDFSEPFLTVRGIGAWMDRVFPPPPRSGGTNASLFAALAGGSSMDGCRYNIVRDNDGWFIQAEDERGGVRLRVDAGGGMERLDQSGNWIKYHELLF